ncbi:MAG: hypothetical protein WDO24_01780 [Pseudomonadota bacterium]
MDNKLECIESTAGEVAAELTRRGVPPDQKVMITIEPDDWIARARAIARPQTIVKGWSDADIDREIDEARDEVQPRRG